MQHAWVDKNGWKAACPPACLPWGGVLRTQKLNPFRWKPRAIKCFLCTADFVLNWVTLIIVLRTIIWQPTQQLSQGVSSGHTNETAAQFLHYWPRCPRGLTFPWWESCGLCFDINQSSLPTPSYSVLVSISVFMALSSVFHSINSPDKSPPSHSVLPVLFLPYRSFQLYQTLKLCYQEFLTSINK